ncbi:MAG TPA: hypothetical protein VK689_12220, partial [Armatimonadota bacterium]|nr:hypothetical protein [Armatimonadota bacterium]
VGRPLPETVDEFVRESAVVVVGVGAGNDGGFYPPPQTSLQYTTYYLRVIGYLKDETGRRAPFLKILAPGGFLNGGQKADAPLPYLEAGRRYLLYLRPNRGLDWGNLGHTSSPIGRGDEYWTSGRGGGLWWEEEGRLVGYVDPPTHWGLPFKVGVLPWPDYLPFGQAVQRAVQAVERERRGVPLVPRPYEPLTFLND